MRIGFAFVMLLADSEVSIFRERGSENKRKTEKREEKERDGGGERYIKLFA